MAKRVRVRSSVVAVKQALVGLLEREVSPSRLMGAEVHFPDIGAPVVEKVGFLRYPGEVIEGDAEPVAADSTSDHSIDRSNEDGYSKA